VLWLREPTERGARAEIVIVLVVVGCHHPSPAAGAAPRAVQSPLAFEQTRGQILTRPWARLEQEAHLSARWAQARIVSSSVR
jgi:hypothetical protein